MEGKLRRLTPVAIVLTLLAQAASPVQVSRLARAATSQLEYGANVATESGLGKTKEMGFGWVRVYFPEQVEQASRLGLKVLLLLGWESALSDVKAFGDSVYHTVSRYRGRASAYQICNEPNLAEMWHKPKHADPAEYVAYLKEAYRRAKEADPGCIIVSAGLAVNGGAGDRAMDDIAFLRGMYAAGAKSYFDALGSHPYGFGYAPEDATSNPIHCFRRVEQQHQVMAQNGDGAKPIWATEVGWIVEPHSACYGYDGWDGWWWQRVSLQTQADYLVRAYRYARTQWPWMGVMFLWNMDYNLASWNEYCDPVGWFSILNHDGTPRPSYTELARMAREGAKPTATATPDTGSGTGSVVGKILLQGRSNHMGAWISVGGRTTTSAADGAFRMEGVPVGLYQLRVSRTSYLRHLVSGLVVSSGALVTVPDITLRGGDVNLDDKISLADLVAVAVHYGSQVSADDAQDISGDGRVDLVDLVLVGSNYGASVLVP